MSFLQLTDISVPLSNPPDRSEYCPSNRFYVPSHHQLTQTCRLSTVSVILFILPSQVPVPPYLFVRTMTDPRLSITMVIGIPTLQHPISTFMNPRLPISSKASFRASPTSTQSPSSKSAHKR